MSCYKALVVEDDPKAIEVIEDVLTALGHEHDLANCLVEARRLVRANRYSYVLLDIEFPARTPKGEARVQNAENFLDELAAWRQEESPPVVILSDRKVDRPEDTEHLMRLAMSLGHKGARDLIQKPFPTAGRTLDRVIKKVLGLNGNSMGQGPCSRAGQAVSVSKAEPSTPIVSAKDESGEEKWLTVTQAAELLAHDLPGLGIKKARSRISTAAGRKEFKFTGSRRDRRIEPNSFAAWRLKQRDRDLALEEAE